MDSPFHPSHSLPSARFASIEAGGTKFNVGIGGSDGVLQTQAQFATRSPSETIRDLIEWLDAEVAKDGPVSAIGMATFGPIDTDPGSVTWGRLGPTPKLSWQGTDLITPFRSYGVPVALDTDVNGAALAEWRWGAGQGCARLCYLTIGTGIGGGAVLDGKMLSGRSHPEMGHMFIRRHPQDEFEGACAAHGDCLEGLASGTAIHARWDSSLSKLGPDHPGHEIIASYLAQACVNVRATLAPEKIVLGGGVIGTEGLLARVHTQFDVLAQDYFSGFAADDIVLAKLYPVSGLMGGLAIADLARQQKRSGD
ncbi:ROK family protein [Sphingomonas agri]|uniref:ROK family protein n=1 Tax=Sphingomonas agri TaxID=1813878 RepID=UPI00311FF22E